MPQKIIIIGAGIIGLSCALELAGRGMEVSVLDRREAGMEASWAGGGILSPLLPWDYPEEVTALALEGAALYPEWTSRLHQASGIDPEYTKCGMTVIDAKRFTAEALDWCSAHRMRCSAGEADELYLPDIAQVRNPRLLHALRTTLEAMGVEIREHCEVRSLGTLGKSISHLDVPDAALRADAYVLCAGAWSGAMLGRSDIYPVKGQMLLFDAPGLLDTILLKDGFYLIPRRDGLILAGSTLEQAGFDKSLTREASLHEAAAAMLPGLERLSPVKHWAGLRPGSPGNVPTIARHPEFENLYVNTGHFRYGVTMAPASAKRLAGIVFGEPEDPAYTYQK